MNRDESFFRDTAALQYWPDSGLYCGKDLVKGGTWLGINKKGIHWLINHSNTELSYYNLGWFVAVTNIRRAQVNNFNSDLAIDSRGGIPFKLLSQNVFDPFEWEKIIKRLNCLNYNVIFGDLSEENGKIYAYSSESLKLIELPRNEDTFTIFSLANGDIYDSKWFKQRRGEELIQNAIPEISEDGLFGILT